MCFLIMRCFESKGADKLLGSNHGHMQWLLPDSVGGALQSGDAVTFWQQPQAGCHVLWCKVIALKIDTYGGSGCQDMIIGLADCHDSSHDKRISDRSFIPSLEQGVQM